MLCLSDVTVVLDTDDGIRTYVDQAIEEAASPEPIALAGLRIGTPEHKAALDNLIATQQATRNRPGGCWCAAATPEAAHHALTAT